MRQYTFLFVLLFAVPLFAGDQPFYGSIGPYGSWAFPNNTVRYGMKIVLLGRFDQYGYKQYELRRKIGMERREVRYPGYHIYVFSGFIDPGLRGQFRWLECGAGFSPFWMKEYVKGIHGKGFDNLRELAVPFRFSAAYVFAFWKTDRNFINLRFDYAIPFPKQIKRFELSVFYIHALNLPDKSREHFAQHQFGIQLYYKPKVWYRL